MDCEVVCPMNLILCVWRQAWPACSDRLHSFRRPRPCFGQLFWTLQLVVPDLSAFLDLQLQLPMSTSSCSRSSLSPAPNRESNRVAAYHICSVDPGTQSSRRQPRLQAPFCDVFEVMWLAVQVAQVARAARIALAVAAAVVVVLALALALALWARPSMSELLQP